MNKRKLMTAVCGAVLGASLWGTTVFADETHEVSAGESLWKISQKYDVSVSDIKSWNNLSGNGISAGQNLVVSKEDGSSEQKDGQHTYTVKSGDSLWKIATMHGMSVASLKDQNGLSSNWISSGQKLAVNGKATSASTPSSTTQAAVLNAGGLIEEAKSHIGTPYAWGGTTPGGFDCSGYLNYVYQKAADVDLPRTVASIYADDRMESVSSSDRKPGDLVFFETYKAGASHAGIYVGNNKFIHSSSSRGIRVDSLSSGYWSPRYLGTKRIAD
ncbi:NlpC/P60 family protein [Halobacillus litoralis]|uniref:C40 family peptidase n=1 Tax=Halobacillus litoralis TaxID=45668 RepID=UPI001CD68F3E|nr:C40 family peptidase [Halobacillus litoralis]MCA0971808.1 NlpC/P60 family protein [Halobacillus litoralis]